MVIPKDGFDESIDLDTLVLAVQAIFIVVSVGAWQAVRRTSTASARVPLRMRLGFGHKL